MRQNTHTHTHTHTCAHTRTHSNKLHTKAGSSAETTGQKGGAQYIYSDEREKPTPTREYFSWQDSHSDMMERLKGLQHHQTSFTRDVQETSLSKKIKEATTRNRKIMKGKHSLVKQMPTNGSKLTTHTASRQIKRQGSKIDPHSKQSRGTRRCQTCCQKRHRREEGRGNAGMLNVSEIKRSATRLPRWLRGKESACQHRRPGFDPWPGKIPHAAGPLSQCPRV